MSTFEFHFFFCAAIKNEITTQNYIRSLTHVLGLVTEVGCYFLHLKLWHSAIEKKFLIILNFKYRFYLSNPLQFRNFTWGLPQQKLPTPRSRCPHPTTKEVLWWFSKLKNKEIISNIYGHFYSISKTCASWPYIKIVISLILACGSHELLSPKAPDAWGFEKGKERIIYSGYCLILVMAIYHILWCYRQDTLHWHY